MPKKKGKFSIFFLLFRPFALLPCGDELREGGGGAPQSPAAGPGKRPPGRRFSPSPPGEEQSPATVPSLSELEQWRWWRSTVTGVSQRAASSAGPQPPAAVSSPITTQQPHTSSCRAVETEIIKFPRRWSDQSISREDDDG